MAKGMRVGGEVAELGVVTGAVDKLLLGLGVKFEVRTKPSQISLEAVGGSAAAMRRATSPIFTMAKSLP